MKSIKLALVLVALGGSAHGFSLNGLGPKISKIDKDLVAERKALHDRILSEKLTVSQALEEASRVGSKYDKKYREVRQEQIGGPVAENALVLTGLAASALDIYALTSKDPMMHKIAAGAGEIGAVAGYIGGYAKMSLLQIHSLYDALGRAKERYERFTLADCMSKATEQLSTKERERLVSEQKKFIGMLLAEGLGRGALYKASGFTAGLGAFIAFAASLFRNYKLHGEYGRLIEKAEAIRDGNVDEDGEDSNDDSDAATDDDDDEE